MPSGDRWCLLTIIVFSIISFLPWMQEIQISGMALFGWMMAALMILSPHDCADSVDPPSRFE